MSFASSDSFLRPNILLLKGKMLGQILVTKQTGPQGKVVSKV